jgi:SMC interacting uncharacterized protein involved in chromosome segregation
MIKPEREEYLRSLVIKHDPHGTHTMGFEQCMRCVVVELFKEIDDLRTEVHYFREGDFSELVEGAAEWEYRAKDAQYELSKVKADRDAVQTQWWEQNGKIKGLELVIKKIKSDIKAMSDQFEEL